MGKNTGFAVVAFLLFVGALVLVLMNQPEQQEMLPSADGPIPELYPVPDFALFDSREEVITLDDYADTVWVANFFFTACAGPCPTMIAHMATLQETFPPGSGVKFASYSVDPETDTPERLAAYAERYKANTVQWHFLTGPMEEINMLAYEGFKLGSVDEPVFHSTKFVLVDQKGVIRGYFDGYGEQAEEGMEELKSAIRALQKES